MLYSPLVALIDRFFGKHSWVYWVWTLIVGAIIGGSLAIGLNYGFSSVKVALGIGLLVWIVPVPFISWYENKWYGIKRRDNVSHR